MGRTTVRMIEAEYHRYKNLGEGVFRQLAPDELVDTVDETNSSIATLVWHIAGNLESRFTDFLETDGEKPWRDRESEFDPRPVASPAELMEKWERGWSILFTSLGCLRDEDLTRIVTIRGIEFRVDEALLRSLAHASYHVGQIVYLGKRLRGEAWVSLSIPHGESSSYNANPKLDKAVGPEPGENL